MEELLRHLIETHKIIALEKIFGIKDATWRQHKAFIDNKGSKGQKISSKHYKFIRNTYKTYLLERLSDIDPNRL